MSAVGTEAERLKPLLPCFMNRRTFTVDLQPLSARSLDRLCLGRSQSWIMYVKEGGV